MRQAVFTTTNASSEPMPPVTRTEDEEANLLDDIFSELDSSAGVKTASPARPRVTIPPPRTPARAARVRNSPLKSSDTRYLVTTAEQSLHCAHDEDLDALMDGAGDWDWDDMNSDIMTPRRSSPVKPKVTLQRGINMMLDMTNFATSGRGTRSRKAGRKPRLLLDAS